MLNTQNPALPFNAASAETFAERIGETINAGAITLMLSIGHRTGLFDTMALLPHSTSREIADNAGLSERYVREWLAVMVTGRIIHFVPKDKTYTLPAEHAASLTRNAVLGNMAVYAQFVPMSGAVEERILSCFKTGDGLGYNDYPCFHRIMAEDSSQSVVSQLSDTVLPLVPGLDARLKAGIEVMDAGCGSGHALLAMAALYPTSRFTGYDLCGEVIEAARQKAIDEGLANISFEQRNLTGFDETERYDFITSFDAVHDQKHPQEFLKNLYRALKSGGVYLMQDIGGSAHLENNIDFPFASFLYTASCMHCTPISLGQGGDGLGTMWGWETAQKMLETAGFASITRHVLPHDPMNVWFVSHKI